MVGSNPSSLRRNKSHRDRYLAMVSDWTEFETILGTLKNSQQLKLAYLRVFDSPGLPFQLRIHIQ
jgi:hypothetical protein